MPAWRGPGQWSRDSWAMVPGRGNLTFLSAGVSRSTHTAPRPRKRDVLGSLRQPKVAVMLGLGFSSGLPFLLSGNTLGYWLRDEGTTLKAIGFLSWVGLAYSLKFLWAPV